MKMKPDRNEELPVSFIDPGTRFRKDYGDLSEMIQSIKEIGLINPITVAKHPETPDRYILLAGGRRLSCFLAMEQPSIRCEIYDRVLDEYELRLIELHENIKRKDMTYAERIKLVQEVDRLYKDLYGKKTSTSPDAPGHSLRDTAKLFGQSPATISQDLKLARTMDMFPQVQWDKCKNRNEALKLASTIETTLVRKDLADKATKVLGTYDEIKSRLIKSYIVGDFFENVKQIPDNSISLVEIDPPYAINLGKVKKKDGNYSKYDFGDSGYNEIDKADYECFMCDVFKESYRVMSANSWLICWFGPDPWFNDIYTWLVRAGFETRRLVGVWAKGEDADGQGLVEKTSGQSHIPTRYLAAAYEMFYYAWKGQPTLAKPGATNVFGYKPVTPSKKIHPTERPLELIEDLLTTFAVEGSRILVPFAGSGQTLIAAAKNKMLPIGFDISESFRDGYILRVNEIF